MSNGNGPSVSSLAEDDWGDQSSDLQMSQGLSPDSTMESVNSAYEVRTCLKE